MKITLLSGGVKMLGLAWVGGALLGKRKEGRGSPGVGGEREKGMVKLTKTHCIHA